MENIVQYNANTINGGTQVVHIIYSVNVVFLLLVLTLN